MMHIPEQRHPVVLNPGGGGVRIDDVDTFLADWPAAEEPMIDLGGGMIVSLRELVSDAYDDDQDAS